YMKKSLLFLFSFLLLSNITYAASIAKLRGQRALIHLEGLTAKKGDRFYSLDANNKKRALLRITSVKSGKAIGLVIRGKAQEGQKLQAVASSTSKSSQDTSLPPAPRSSMSNLGILGSYLVNQMSAKFSLD